MKTDGLVGSRSPGRQDSGDGNARPGPNITGHRRVEDSRKVGDGQPLSDASPRRARFSALSAKRSYDSAMSSIRRLASASCNIPAVDRASLARSRQCFGLLLNGGSVIRKPAPPRYQRLGRTIGSMSTGQRIGGRQGSASPRGDDRPRNSKDEPGAGIPASAWPTGLTCAAAVTAPPSANGAAAGRRRHR